MASSIQFFILAAVLAAVLGQNYNISRVANGTNDYFKIAQAELLYSIKLSEMENDALDVRYRDRLGVVEQQQQQVLNETKQVNQTLIALQALNLIRKYCIQTYDSQLITYQSIQNQFKICINQVKNYDYSLTSSARSYTSSARNYALYQLPRNLEYNCPLVYYYFNQTKLEQCYIENVQIAADNVQRNLKNAQVSRDQKLLDMNRYVLTAIECSFKIEKNALAAIALTSKKIDDCVDDMSKKSGSGNKKALN